MDRGPDRPALVRLGLLVAGSTLAATASFVGLVAVLTGATPGLPGRLPLYVFGTAAAFLVAILRLEGQGYRGRPVLGAAVGVALATFVVLGLAGEGVLYAVRNPGTVVASELVFYFLAAGLLVTGLGYWGLNHWREFADGPTGL